MNQQANSEDITEAQEFQSNSTSPKLAFVGSVITEAEVFGDLTDFKHAKEVEIPDQKDGGFTFLRQLEKTPKIEMSAKECMIELHNRLLALRNRAAEIGEQEYIESLIFLAAKAHHKFDPNFLTPETVMRQCMPEPF